jgi:ABC-type transport system involved in cytochrome c biogenesis ATPase subunit
LRDVAADDGLFEQALAEDVTKVSLLRSVSSMTVRGQFRRLARGGARLTPFHFSYTAPTEHRSSASPLVLTFEVEPESEPPTNVHVLVGRNGVGKTRILRMMSQALVDPTAPAKTVGRFVSGQETNAGELFANLVSVTFSAFDPFEPLRPRRDASVGVRYTYIGLQRPRTQEGKTRSPKRPAILSKEFVESVRACRVGAKGDRWRRALQALEADPLFQQADITGLAEGELAGSWEADARKLFSKLSSGHKIVLLTITRLVEAVDERTLVLLDEPEAHLHPPLLSAFVRALSDLLVHRNGVAIVATHSPVVLQEVPMTCAWKLQRVGAQASADRPEVETFGENVGVLTREAFGLEVTHSGFHSMIRRSIAEGGDYSDVLERFGHHLGAEARAIVRGLIAVRDAATAE